MLNLKSKRFFVILPGIALIRKRAFLAALLTLALTPTAYATVIVNGSFETDPLSPWTTTSLITLSQGTTPNATDGAKVGLVVITGGETSGTLSQSFTLAEDGLVDYAFQAGRSETACGCNDVPLTFTARIDDIILSTVLPAFDVDGSGGVFGVHLPTSYSGSLALLAGDHTLSFQFTRGFNLFGRAPYFALDGVGVTPQEVIAPPPSFTDVPEPMALSLLTSGLGIIALHDRGRKQRRAALTAA